MTYDTVCTRCGAEAEIIKTMQAALPDCADCGGVLKRIYSVTPVHYHAEGFSSNDKRFKSQLKPERYEKFQREKAGIEARAAKGQLTQYEKMLEGA